MSGVPDSPATPSGSARRGRFYHETVVFEVEGTLHRVYKYGFERRSRIFRDIFQNPQGEPPNVEGQSDANPIRLVGCTNLEFECLIEVMYPLDLTLPVLLKEEWVAVLKLSNLWEMDELVKLAMDKLEALQLTPCENIQFGKAFGIPRWISEGYKSLATSNLSSQFSLDDLTGVLGWETTCRILWVRELTTTFHQAQPQRSSNKGFWVPSHELSCGTCHLDGVEKTIRSIHRSCEECDQLPSYSGVIMDRSARRKFRTSISNSPGVDYWVGSDKLLCPTCYEDGHRTQLQSGAPRCPKCGSGPSSTIVAWGLTLEMPELIDRDEEEEEEEEMMADKVAEMVEAELEEGSETVGQY